VIQAALERMHGHSVRLTGAGRTDSGVHAAGQVANFMTDIDSIPARRFRDAVNSFLPRDVRVLSSEEVGERFHSRRSAILRVYSYRILQAPVCPPHLRNFCHWTRRKPDIGTLNRMASLLVGRHDFTSFSARGDRNRSKVREVAVSSFRAEGSFLVYTIAASSFLWKMVRTVIGTILMLEEEGMGAAELAHIIEARSRFEAGGTAPAQGLSLERVVYDEKEIVPL
jgi:tRNA pseudouridine38-40 synthase